MTEQERSEIRRRVADERAEQGLAPTVEPDAEALAVLAAVARKVVER